MKTTKLIALLSIILYTFQSCVKENVVLPEQPLTYSIQDTLIDGATYKKIEGTINESVSLGNTYTYLLSGLVYVEKDLTIEHGTIIYAESDRPTALIINRDANLFINGEKQNPVVFTSIKEVYGTANAGDWIGIHINGNAALNSRDNNLAEIIGKYGRIDNSANDLDSSGMISFCRIEYAGATLNGTSGGLNLNGVGMNTLLENIQLYKSQSSAFRFRGGTASLKWAIASDTQGKSYRWDDGWRGFGQFWVAYYNNTITDTFTAIEGRNGTALDTPISNPILSNITIVGKGSEGNDAIRGIRFRDATYGEVYNSLITKCQRAVRADNAQIYIEEGNLNFAYNNLFANNPNYYSDSSSAAGLFEENTFMNTNVSVTMTDYIGVLNDNSMFDINSLHEWFDIVNYKGAVPESDNWTLGWIR